MTLDDVEGFAQLAGALATIATLIYLAVQIRQNTATMRSASITSYIQAVSSVSTLLSENREVCDLYFKGLETPDSLTDFERRRFYMLIGTFISYLQQAYYMQAEGSLPADLTHQYSVQLDWLVCQPGFLLWYEHWQDSQPPAFRNRIKQAMDRGAAMGLLGVSTEGSTDRDQAKVPVTPKGSAGGNS